MRKYLIAASTVAALAAVPTAASAQYYYNDGYARPGAVYVNPPAVYAAPPPMVESQVYLAPGQTLVPPGTAYTDDAVYVGGERYYRDCWWDWGQRRCELKPWR